MAKQPKVSDHELLKQEMSGLIDEVNLTPLQKRFMKGRWLDQVLWLENRAQQSRDRYYFLRLVTIIGGVIVPALVSLNINDNNVRKALGWATFGLSQAVALSAAVEEFFHYGDRYRRYRNTAEGMKIEGWQFFQLSGPYNTLKSHADAYNSFATRIENIIQRDVEGYVSEVVQESAPKGKELEESATLAIPASLEDVTPRNA